MTIQNLRLLVAVVFAVMTGSASAALLFDNSGRPHLFVDRDSESSPLAVITVEQETTINQIGALVDLKNAGNLKFVIFEFTALDFTAGNRVFSTGAQAFADDGQTYKVSSIFADFVLHPGTAYGIGAIADVDGAWAANDGSFFNPFTENGITASDDANGNVVSFVSPDLAGPGPAMVMLRLYGFIPTGGGDNGGGGGGTVPEPGTLALVGLALAGLGTTRRRKP